MATAVGTPGASGLASVGSHTFSMTVLDVPNRIVSVGVTFGDANAEADLVTVGGVSGFRAIRTPPFSTGHATEQWYVINPPAGAQTVFVRLTATAESSASAQQLEDVDQTNPVRHTASASNHDALSTIGATVNSSADDVVIGVLAMNGTTLPTALSGQTNVRQTNNSDVAIMAYMTGTAPTASMQWTNNSGATVDWTLALVSYQSPTGGGSGTTVTASLSETFSHSDSTIRQFWGSRQAGETLSFSDSSNRSGIFNRSNADSFTLSDTITLQSIVTAIIADIFTFTDTTRRWFNGIRRLSDNQTLGENFQYTPTGGTGPAVSSGVHWKYFIARRLRRWRAFKPKAGPYN